MIPKILHFVWIDNRPLPLYAQRSMCAFKEMNPDFDVKFHLCKIQQGDVEAGEVYSKIFDQNIADNFYRQMFYTSLPVNLDINTKHGRNSRFVDCLKFWILNKYGGIYLDLDTWPIKPLSDLCQYESIGVNFLDDSYDLFMLGFEQGKIFDHFKYQKLGNFSFYEAYGFEKSLDYRAYEILLKMYKVRNSRFMRNFTTGTLKIGDKLIIDNVMPNYYIDHIRTHEWEN